MGNLRKKEEEGGIFIVAFVKNANDKRHSLAGGCLVGADKLASFGLDFHREGTTSSSSKSISAGTAIGVPGEKRPA